MSDYLVNTIASGTQSEPVVTVLSNGNYVVVWASEDGLDAGSFPGNGIRAQLHASDGTPIGSEILVNTSGEDAQVNPVVQALDGGGFAILWSSADMADWETTGSVIRGRIFDDEGTAATDDFTIFTDGDNASPSITALSDGNYLVTWTNMDFVDWHYDVRAQVIDATGATVGSSFLVSESAEGTQNQSATATLSGGTPVVAFAQHNPDTGLSAIYVRLLDPTGQTPGAEILVSGSASDEPAGAPDVTALADGGFMVVWSGADGIYGQRFDSSSNASGGILTISTQAGSQTDPQVVALEGGGFFVLWTASDEAYGAPLTTFVGDGSGAAIRGRFFDENSVAIAQDVVINTTTAGAQTQPDVTLLDNGKILITYQSNDLAQGVANGAAIRAAVIDPPASSTVDEPVTALSATPAAASFAESTAIGTTIATLAGTDPESGPITYEILNWAGGKFEIVGDEVRLRSAFDFEAADEYEVLIRATDSAGNATDTSFTVAVTDVAEVPAFVVEATAGIAVASGNAMSITLDDGRFVVAYRGTGSSETRAQVYNVDGTTAGVSFTLESDTTGSQLNPSLAARPDGGFVAVWTASSVVSMRIFDEDLAPQGDQVAIGTTAGTNRTPSVAVFEDGSFVVVWSGSGTSGDSDGSTVRAQLFAATGTPIGDDFIAVSTTEGNVTLTNQAATALEGGRFVVTWASSDTGSADTDGGTIIRARVFEADGDPVGDDFVVNASTTGFQNTASILALDDGGFLVLWQSSDGGDGGHVGTFEGSTFLVRGQIFDAGGNAVGDELVLNDVDDGQQYQVRATQLADGKIAVVYFSAESAESANYTDTIRLALLDVDGTPVGDSVVIAKAGSLGSAVIGNPQITALADGRVAVSWEATDGGTTRVQTAIVDTDPPLGFTGSEGLVWEFSSATVPADATAGTVIATITVTYPDTWYEDGAPGSFHVGLDGSWLADGSEISASELFRLEEVDIDLDTNIATYQLVLRSDVAGSELIQDFHLDLTATGYSLDGNDTYVDRGTIQMDLGGDGFVVPDNHAPTDLAVSGHTVAANARAGTVIGTLSAIDADGDTLTYVLETDHDGLFVLVTEGDVTSLVLTEDIDTNVGNGYFLDVKVLDGDGAWDRDLFSIQVTEAEDPVPTDLALSADSVLENSVFGTVVGTLSATAWDGGTLTYTLTDDAGGMFQIVGNELRVTTRPDYEAATSHTVTVKVTEQNGGETTKDFTIAIGDVDEGPVISLSNTAMLESARTGMVVGTLSGIDPEAAGEVTLSLVAGAGDNNNFALRTNGDGSVSVVLRNSLDHESSGGVYDLVVKASDANGNDTTKTIGITVADDPFKFSATPTGKTYASIAESAPVGTQIGNVLQFDTSFIPVSATLVDDAGGLFSITTGVVGSETRYYLTVNGELDYETANVHAVTIRATDAGGTSYDKTFDIHVVDAAEVGDAPAGAITIDAGTLLAAENGGVDWDTYLDAMYQLVAGSLPAGVTFAPSVADEYLYTLTDGSLLSMQGSDLAYWWSDPVGEDVHVVAGTINTIVFGNNDEAAVTGSITNPEVSITGLDLTSGAEQMARIFGEANIAAVTWMYGPTAGHPADIEFFKLLLASHAQTFIGSDGGDVYTGTVFDDTITGGKGDDRLDGGEGTDTAVFTGNKLDYSWADNGDGTWTITDSRADGDGTDTLSNVEMLAFTDGTVSIDGPGDPVGTITIDASGSATGIDFEAYVRGDFIADATGGGFPVFDNSAAFDGEEMMIAYGTGASARYVLAHGDLEYYFGTHTVAGTIDTIEFGTRGSGSYDANGYFVGGNATLRITGLSLANAIPTTPEEEAAIEADGAVHNFAVAYMYGASAEQARLDAFADALDGYAQNFIGSEGNDVYAGTRFDDTISGGGGEDVLAGGGGNDTVDGGDGADTWVLTGNYADYEVTTAGAVTTVVDRRASPVEGTATLRNVETLRFADQQVAIVLDLPPVGIALSKASVLETAAIGTVVGVVTASDPEGGPLTYALGGAAADLFEMVGNEIRVKSGLDFETAESHDLKVTVTDEAGNSASKTFVIAVTDVEEGGKGKDKFKGTKGDDLFAGLGGKDVIKGGKGNDILDGGAGRDRLDGGKGDDILIGGAGKDVLKGGKGADTFVFQFASDSTAKGKGRDTILDFKRKDGDKIDLSAIDPLNDTGTFEYIGKAKFSGEAGELRWQKKSGSTLITADIDGDGKADFSIALAKATAMKEADFIL